MSRRYKGAIISATAPTTSTTSASGEWTLPQQFQAQGAGTWPTPPLYIEDVFSTYLYTGTAATLSIANNINLSGNGGLVWLKCRSQPTSNELYDTSRGASKRLFSNQTDGQATNGDLNGFTSNGFSLGYVSGGANTSGESYVSWTFAKQSKFFDIVTYTGTGAAGNVSHALGTTPGFLIIKRVSSVGNWGTFARDGTSSSKYTYSYFNTAAGLNLTSGASFTNQPAENSGYITSTTFDPNNLSGSSTVGNVNNFNDSGVSYVAYLFAHNAGGFPANGGGSTDGISCGGFTADGSGNATITLGYEPQWLMVKRSDGASAWFVQDVMRSLPTYSAGNGLATRANTSTVEEGLGQYNISTTGFIAAGQAAGGTYIYMAIRRGPMKTPSVGTSVFTPTSTNAAASTSVSIGFPTDMSWGKSLGFADATWVEDRLRGYSNAYSATAAGTGSSPALNTTSTAAETNTQQPIFYKAYNTTALLGQYYAGSPAIYFNFGRAPGFFDVVCYTGTGSATTFSHNLTVVPELMIIKSRDQAQHWQVYSAPTGNSGRLLLSATNALITPTTIWNNTTPTASVFSVDASTVVNQSSFLYVNYLFATLAGISKVGSYTGTAALQTINCGFTSGARFILIKRTDAAGDWYVYDSARGISSSTDPYYLLNSTASQVTGTDYVDTDTTGFKLNAAGSTTVNISAATYIFLAIA